ncbi:PREDICTED: putative tripartite motif-containing protein 75-like [Elephantulus edwardii]|uniref:putative tripartite motif-containing protein 75-like n=1 Tax=Elephantulus edwardii TaxID=28737 RepID=UPI0003F0BC10|nr:PREDICTED: putative tripartite motif-containing protein 75-like [Elephantulus edwardii]
MAGVVAEAKCPICLDLLKDPVTTKCGHNFCRSCMQKSWEEKCNRVSCPLCQQLCQHKILKQNNQLRNILYGAKLYLFSMEMKKKKTPQCKKHKQVLNFFCEDDHKVLCDLCTRVHWSCNVKPLKQIASHHRKQIMDYVTTLRNQLDDYTNSRAIQEKKVKQVNQSIAKVWHKLNYECKHMNHFLEWQHNICVSRAAYVERVKQKIHKETCSNCISIRTCLKQEVAERSVIMDNIKLLTRIKNIYNVCDNLTPPSSSSIQLSEREANLPPLFKPLKKIKAFKRDVTLDPETAHPSLLIPEVKKSVTFVMEKEILLPTLKRFSTFPLVLGSEGFDSGRHYWEVRVNDKPEWMNVAPEVERCISSAKAQWFRSPNEEGTRISKEDTVPVCRRQGYGSLTASSIPLPAQSRGTDENGRSELRLDL